MKVASKEVRPKDNVEEPPALVEDHQPWKGEEVTRFCLVQVNRWESWVNTLKRDYQQNVAETARVGLLIMMAPDELNMRIVCRNMRRSRKRW